MLRTLKIQAITILFSVLNIVAYVEAQKGARGGGRGGRRSGGGRRNNSEDTTAHYSTGMYICMILFALCVIPTVGIFAYNLYKDPMTPELLKRAAVTVKDNALGYLSKKPEAKNE